MKTAKALGYKKGDCVLMKNGFVCVIMSDAHTATPCMETWGFEHEMGSSYAEDIQCAITKERLKGSEFFIHRPHVFSAVAKKALEVK